MGRDTLRTTHLGPSSLPPAAGPVRRILATVVDMTVFCALCGAVAWPTIRSIDWAQAWVGIDVLAAEISDPSWSSHAASILGIWIALWWCYFAVGWGVLGATPGKWLLGLRVMDHRGVIPIGVPRALLRMAAYMISSITMGLGHTLVAFRRDHRALHDMLAGTRVVDRRFQRQDTSLASNPDNAVDGHRDSEPDPIAANGTDTVADPVPPGSH